MIENKDIWVLDPAHSEIEFKVKHLMITNVKGAFRKFSATIEPSEEGFDNAIAKASIDVSSIFTNNEDRDAHLRSVDFFDTANFQEIKFSSIELIKFDTENGQLTGDLTIKDTTRTVVFELEFAGLSKDPWGNLKTGFSLNGKINRKDFGLTWNAALETGGVLVSEDVKIVAELQFIKLA